MADESGYVPSDFLLGHADEDEAAKKRRHKQERLSETGLLRPDEVGVDVDDVLNVLESGAYKIGWDEKTTKSVIRERQEREDEEWERGNNTKFIGTGSTLNLHRHANASLQDRKDSIATNAADATADAAADAVVGGSVNPLLEDDDWGLEDDDDDEDLEEYSDAPDDWGEELSVLVRTAYTDVGVQDGASHPDQKALLNGATAVLEWMEKDAGIAPNIFTLNSYLSVHARCMWLQKAKGVYLSYEPKYNIAPDTRTVAIMLEMLTRAKRFDHAMQFFRKTTGTEHLDNGDNAQRKRKQGEPTNSRQPFRKSDLDGIGYVDAPNQHHYGILIRGASTLERYEDVAHLIREMQTFGFEPRDADTFMLRKTILGMDFTDLNEAEDYLIEILGDKFAKRLAGRR